MIRAVLEWLRALFTDDTRPRDRIASDYRSFFGPGHDNARDA